MQPALMALSATLLLQMGYFMWKLAVDRQPTNSVGARLPAALALVLGWRWLLGLAMVVAGWLLFVQATSVGELSLIQPLMSAGDVVLVLMSVVLLRERLSRLEGLGIAATIGGAVLLASDATRVQASSYDLRALLLLFGLAAAAVLASLWWSQRHARAEVGLALAVGLLFGAGATLTKVLAAQQAAIGVDVLSLQTLGNPMVAAVVAANVTGLVLLHLAFKIGRAAVVVPVQLAAASAFAVLAGGFAFNESITLWRASGVLVILLGTAVLHAGHASEAGRSRSPPAITL